MDRIAIFVRVNRDAFDSVVTAGADNTNGNFTTIGN
jgi:hypothetical protein